MEDAIYTLYKINGITNPSAIVSCLYLKGYSGRFGIIRKVVIKEIQRINNI